MESKTTQVGGVARLAADIFFPFLFVLLLWVVKALELYLDINLVQFGLFPRRIDGLIGVVTSPLLHSSLSHLLSNTFPLLILGAVVFYFYRSIAFSVFFWVYVMTGIWVWAAGRPAYHIGSSGLVYGFVCFLFFSGIFRKETKLMALSMLVAFVYGSLVWGVFPIQSGISWESHLLGSLAGLVTAIYFKNEGPQAHRYSWEDEEEEDDDGAWRLDPSPTNVATDEQTQVPKSFTITYVYVANPASGLKQANSWDLPDSSSQQQDNNPA